MNKNICLSVFQQHLLSETANLPSMPFHKHESLEISYVKEGYILIEYDSAKTEELNYVYVHKHQFVIIKPNCRHRMIFPTRNETIGVEFTSVDDNIYDHICKSNYVNTLPHRAYASELLKSFEDLIVFTDVHNVEYQLRLFKKYANDSNDEYADEIFDLELKRLFIEILKCGIPAKSRKANLYLNKALSFIRLNYYKNVKVKDVVEYLNISETYLQNMFRKEFNASVSELINKTRIEKATELIGNTNFPLRKIAESIGYNTVQSFIINFKKFKNCTPSQYKKNITNNHFFRKNF